MSHNINFDFKDVENNLQNFKTLKSFAQHYKCGYNTLRHFLQWNIVGFRKK